MSKNICFIAQFPPPMHGLSKAVDTLYRSELSETFAFDKVNITNNKQFLQNVIRFSKSKADLFYFTISQTRSGNLRDLIILELLALQRKKCLVHLHGGYYRTLVDQQMPSWQKKANYRAMKRLAGAIVLGPSLEWIFEGMLPADRIHTVANCVDDEYLLSDEELEEKLASLDQRPVKHVLYLSNFIRTKGYPEVLAMALAEKARCDAGEARTLHFDFAGKFFDKAEEDFFFGYVKEHSIEAYITYHGTVGGRAKRALLKSCDIFVLLTRYPNEGQPISILEAMGNGMTIITTDHAGIPDVVQSQENGIVVTGEPDPVLLTRQLRTLDLRAIGCRNRDKIMTGYRQAQYIANMEKVFERT